MSPTPETSPAPPLSVCVTIKNRSRIRADGQDLRLFPRCVESLVRSAVHSGIRCELVVADWTSDDWPLHEWLFDAARPLLVRVVALHGTFSRGRGRNAAGGAARGNSLFFLDADCLVSPQLLDAAVRYASTGQSYFPIVYSFADPQHLTGWWREEGYGNCVISRETFDRSGGWPEYVKWGHEDDEFFVRVHAVSDVVRERGVEFYHQWHPNDREWKDQLIELTPGEQVDRALARTAAEELSCVVPVGSTITLIDDASIGRRLLQETLPGRRVTYFVDREGDYWGPPADDAAALEELHRQRTELGTRFVAYAWTSFWWLQQYPGLLTHLNTTARRVLDTERVLVFDIAENA
jgi:hypothetical protein